MCLISSRSCCRCCSNRPINPFPPIPTPMPIEPNNVAARFNLISSTEVTSGSTIPLTNVVFNNAGSDIQLNNNSIALAGEGLYLVNYSVTATNGSDASLTFTVNLNVNGSADASASASGNILAGESTTVSNSTLVYVPANSASTITLGITSDETLSLVPNVVVTKLS